MTTEHTLFTDLGLSQPILSAIEKVGYEQPSPIQARSIPTLLAGRDILGIAQTGTGKTAAFALPLLNSLDVNRREPQILVLAPTRELAIQVSEAFKTYAAHMPGFHVLPLYGGSDFRGQIKGLQRGAQVIVGTPGRLMDHMRRGNLSLDTLKAVVLDEADEMLRMGFIDDVTWILDQTPDDRQVALFSATMPREIRHVAETYLNDPEIIKIASETQTVDRIEQRYWLVRGVNKLDALTRILEVENFDALIIFVRTKNLTVELAEKLEARGFSASALNGDMSQALRERAIERLKNGQLDVVVATDVAARGIDVSRISLVVNYDIPYDAEAYVHRIGRTGRAGRSGKAILFVAPRERRMLRTIERTTKQRIEELQLPSRAQVVDKRIDQFKSQISAAMETEELEFFRDLLLQYAEESQAEPLDIAAALAFMAQRERPLTKLVETEVKERSSDRDDRQDSRRRGRQRDRNTNMDVYRLAIGRSQQVRPSDIVGAIANEAGIQSGAIGHIRINDAHSTVELPSNLPQEQIQKLQKIRIKGQPANITLGRDEGRSRGGRDDQRHRGNRDDYSRKRKDSRPARRH